MDFYLQHGHGTQGPFRTESVPAREAWRPQPKRNNVIACRFEVLFERRWRRLYSDLSAKGIPHFINYRGERIAVTGVCP